MAPVKYSIIKRDIKSDKESAVNFDSIEVNADIAHKNYVLLFNEKKNRFVYSFTKNRRDFTSGGAKPYKQKGTGRARQGTIRSPLKVGGAVTFGPKPRLVTRKLNKKYKSDCLKQLLLNKLSNSIIFSNLQSIEKLNQVKKSFDSKKTYLVIIDLNSYDDIVFFNKVKNLKNLYFNNIQSVCVEDLIQSDE